MEKVDDLEQGRAQTSRSCGLLDMLFARRDTEVADLPGRRAQSQASSIGSLPCRIGENKA